jgi:glycosyltransferase involved in cell wall biosynthesis
MAASTQTLVTARIKPRQRRAGDLAAATVRCERSPKLRLLCVLSSANQLYSEIGRNLFELTLGLRDQFMFEFAIDDYFKKNVDHLLNFCAKHKFPAHVGPGRAMPSSLDTVNEHLPQLLGQQRWDVIECVSWASAATNAAVVAGAGAAVFAYTPHFQPAWTVPMSADQASNTEAVHRRLMRTADVVFCDSIWERRQLQVQAGPHGNCVFLPIGCRFDEFRPRPVARRPQLLFVGDLAEPRNRIDRVFAVFARLRRRWPQLRLVLIGSRTEDARDRVPVELQPACECRGYVSDAELRRAYAESVGVLLLSDYESFGIPILEALACGTPVFLSRLDATWSLFQQYQGAHFCPADDLDGTAEVIDRVLTRGADAIGEVIIDREALQIEFNCQAVATQKRNALASAWYVKNRMDRGF